uniref:Replication protein A 70 kDa DNA-binding subunit B/D first OB fold domain-containing protein n=1 Tax=Solanum lycopersicum TaxID=4081 RepID=K4D122_SOLLC
MPTNLQSPIIDHISLYSQKECKTSFSHITVMAYTLISDLDTSRDNWLIRVRVCRMCAFKNYKRSNEMISLGMILIDEKGTLVHAVIWRNQVSRFRANLCEGSVIIIRNFKVSESIGE